jgi:hypothetical protein
MADDTAARLDTRSLMADIEREVRERRRRGDLDPAFERELDTVFEEVAPPGAFGGGFDTVVDQAARHAVVDYDVPITGRRPLRIVKRAVKVLTAWYMIFVGRQVVAFASTTLRALRILGRRVDVLEARSPATDPRVAATLPPVEADLDLAPWIELVCSALASRPARARVVHADCGDGALLVALTDSGVDAYGTDPRDSAASQADPRGIEVRRDEALEHLRSVPDGALGGVVLSGAVDRLTLGDQLELVHHAVRVLAPAAPLVLIGRNPDAWRRARSPIAADLSPGRPLHVRTWVHLLASEPVRDVVCRDGECGAPEAVTTSSDPAVRALAAEVYTPSSYAIVAHRA